MKDRPKIKIKPTATDRLIDVAAWVLLLAQWTLVIVYYSKLPDIIPSHFNLKGDIDGSGGKAGIIFLPILTTVLLIGFTIANRFPHILNYPVKITEDNALRQYTLATKLMRYINLATAILFGTIVFMVIQSAMGEADGLGAWFTPLLLGVMFIPVIVYLVKAFSSKTN